MELLLTCGRPPYVSEDKRGYVEAATDDARLT